VSRPPSASRLGGANALSAGEYELLAHWRHALRVRLRLSEDAARAAALTPAQHQLLVAVKGHPTGRAPSVSDLADTLQLRLHSTLELIKRAEAAGLLARRADPSDARRHLLCLTPLAERRLRQLSRTHRDELAWLVAWRRAAGRIGPDTRRRGD